MQELAYYDSWLTGLVEAALERGGLTPVQRRMLLQRRAEGNSALWSAVSGQGSQVRSWFARLVAIEDAVEALAAAGAEAHRDPEDPAAAGR